MRVVKHGDRTFRSPVEMLRSGHASFTATYRVWREAIGGVKRRKRRVIAASAVDAGATAIEKLAVVYRVNGRRSRVRVTEDVHAFSGALTGLLNSNIAKEVMTPVQRRRFWETLMGLPSLVAVDRKVIRSIGLAQAA